MTGLPFDGDDTGGEGGPAAIAATEQPVPLAMRLLEDERTPKGMLCMGTYRGERLVARAAIPPETWAEVAALGLFDEPVQVVLVAREAPPGLQCQLFAMVLVEPGALEREDADASPWAASVPGAGYEAQVEGPAEPQIAAFPLGHIVRFQRDRVHPDNLALEAVDVLRKVIDGATSEVVDKAIADLFGL